MRFFTTLLVVVLFTFYSGESEAQILKGPDKIKMMQAKSSMAEGDYNGALRIYRGEYTDHGTDAMLNYRMAECYLALNQGEDALAYFQKAEKYEDYQRL